MSAKFDRVHGTDVGRLSECLTDNSTRTFSKVKEILHKHRSAVISSPRAFR